MQATTLTQFLFSVLFFAPGVVLLAGALFVGIFLVVEKVMANAHDDAPPSVLPQTSGTRGPIAHALQDSLAAKRSKRDVG